MSVDAVAWAMRQTAGGPIEKTLLILLGDYEMVVGDNALPGLMRPTDLTKLAAIMECSEDRVREAFRALRDRGLFEILEPPPNNWPFPEDQRVWRLAIPAERVG